ncbi:S41 family peptidase [Paraburkholderia megapolitana]|nr:S41 family peptidase [Paraburkholderia megapolitana]
MRETSPTRSSMLQTRCPRGAASIMLLLMWAMPFSAAAGDIASTPALPPLTQEDVQTLTQAYDIIQRDYARPVDGKALMYGAIKGMVAELDPHSEFLTPDEFAPLVDQLAGGFAGVGLQVGEQDGRLLVFAPIDQAPAQQAGIRAGDVITRIDDIPTQGMTVRDAVARMRGPAGTTVNLSVYRATGNETRTFEITRALIHTSSVSSRIAVPGYAYIRISGFDEQTVPDLANRLRDLARTTPPLKGMVLDLRANGGGVLQDGVGVVSAFVPADTLVVTVREREPGSGHVYRATYEDYRRPSFTGDPLVDLPAMFKTLPLVVLIDAQSVSVTEVVAAALHDTHRATVMGQPSFGKGTIQVTGPLSGGAGLMLTRARYYTPDGGSIQNRGVVPDVSLAASAGADSSNTLPSVREVDLAHHLANPLDSDETAYSESHAREVVSQLRAIEAHNEHVSSNTPLTPAHPAPPPQAGSNDFMTEQALNWLRGQPVIRPPK